MMATWALAQPIPPICWWWAARSPAYCNGTTWVNGSDRNSKEDFAAINPAEVLAKVAALPVTEWNYKAEADGTTHRPDGAGFPRGLRLERRG